MKILPNQGAAPLVQFVRGLLSLAAVLPSLPASAAVREVPLAPEAREQAHHELLREVGRSWQRPDAQRAREGESATLAAPSPVAVKLDGIVLPTVSFTRVPIGQVVAALSSAAEEFDPTESSVKGVNLVLLDPSSQAPRVTLMLRNVTLRRALDFVTEAVGYHYEIKDDAVILRPEGDSAALETEFFPVTRATVLRMTGQGAVPAVIPAGKSGPTTTASAGPEVPAASLGNETAAMRRFLQLAGVNFDDTPGASLADDGAALIVTQTARNLERIHRLLARYDDVRQVAIEAKFMEVQEGALDELGPDWGVATRATQLNARVQATYATGNRSLADAFSSRSGSQQGGIVRPEGTTTAADGSSVVTPALNVPIINNAPQLPGASELAAAAGPLAAVHGVVGEFDVNAVVRALSQKQGTDLLSAPKVTVLSGNPATITVAQEMRYPQSFGQTQSQVGTGSASGGGSAGVAITAGTPQEFTSRNVGVELKVTPTVEDDDYRISLDLNPRVTEFDGFVEYGGPSIAISGSTTVTVPSGFYQPIFSVRDIATRVTLWDGATLMMGGLTREEVKKVRDKVPILGDLPLLGRLFRSKGETMQKRNLLIFVTASLVNPGGGLKHHPAP